MIQIGRVCVKIAGRDAGKKCVIVDILDDNYVLIDGETRRRKCNILHLEPLKEVIKIKKKASHEEIKKEFETVSRNVGELAKLSQKEERKNYHNNKNSNSKINKLLLPLYLLLLLNKLCLCFFLFLMEGGNFFFINFYFYAAYVSEFYCIIDKIIQHLKDQSFIRIYYGRFASNYCF